MKRLLWLLVGVCSAANADWQITLEDGSPYTTQYGNQRVLHDGEIVSQNMAITTKEAPLVIQDGDQQVLLTPNSRMTVRQTQPLTLELHQGQLVGTAKTVLITDYGRFQLPNETWRVYGSSEQLYLLSYQKHVQWQHRSLPEGSKILAKKVVWHIQPDTLHNRLSRMPPSLDRQLASAIGIVGDRLQSDDVITTTPHHW